MFIQCFWLWEGATRSGFWEEPHLHDFDEIIGFISSDPENPKDLGAVMKMNLGDETHFLMKSCLIHIPAGMKHCPLTFIEVRKPVFFFTLAPVNRYRRMYGLTDRETGSKTEFLPPTETDSSGTKYGRYIFTEPRPHAPSVKRPEDEAPKPPKDAKASQIVSLDGGASPGSLYVDFVWIWSGSMTMSPQPHSHDFEELIGIVGSGNRDNHRQLIGDISINIEDERYTLTETSVMYMPKGLSHCPLDFKAVKKPVLCFTIGNTTIWDIKPGK